MQQRLTFFLFSVVTILEVVVASVVGIVAELLKKG
jgi:type III secretory pathway component EscS